MRNTIDLTAISKRKLTAPRDMPKKQRRKLRREQKKARLSLGKSKV